MIYFAQNGAPDLVKIGYSLDPDERVKEGDTWHASPVRIIATTWGDKRRETELHHRWLEHRHRRPNGSWTDWFTYVNDIRAFIDSAKLARGVPRINAKAILDRWKLELPLLPDAARREARR